MASGDTILSINPVDMFPETPGPSGGEYGLVYDGLAKGLSYPHTATLGAVTIRRLPATASLSTGATVKLLIAGDPLNPCAGKVVKLGVNFGKLGTTSTYVAPGTAALGTEATATVTMPSTDGQTIEVSIPIVVASMASAAANAWVLMRVRRLGADSADTARPGRVLLLGVTVLDT